MDQLHHRLNPIVMVNNKGQGAIPWAGATARRLATFIAQAERETIPLTQVVSAAEAMAE